MHYIVFDLELNAVDNAQSNGVEDAFNRHFHEIIQIGAVKLDSHQQTVASFNRYVRPVHLDRLNPIVLELTGITPEQLLSAQGFPQVYPEFSAFIGNADAVFCVWGGSDIKELHRSILYHQLDPFLMPGRYINVQPYASKHFNLSSKKMLRLEAVVDRLGLPKSQSFHNALHDAVYTAEVFQRIYTPLMKPVVYHPSVLFKKRQRREKVEIDFDALIKQLEKMYARELSEMERDMVKLAYRMGRTRQFAKPNDPQ